MIVIDKATLSRIARRVRTEAAALGVPRAHTLYLEACAAALGFDRINAAMAHLRRRAIAVGIPRDAAEHGRVDFLVARVHVRRMLHSARIVESMPPEQSAVLAAALAESLSMKDGIARARALTEAVLHKTEIAVEMDFGIGSTDSMATRMRGHIDKARRSGVVWWDDESWHGSDSQEDVGEKGRVCWEPGTFARPDVALDADAMSRALCGRVALRLPGVLLPDPPVWRGVWTRAMEAEALVGGPGDESGWIPMLPAQPLDDMVRDGRWSAVDVELARMIARLDRRTVPDTPSARTGMDDTGHESLPVRAF